MTGTAMEGLEAAVRLAGAILRPIDAMPAERLPLLAMPASELTGLAAHPSFRGPVNRAVARTVGLSSLTVGEATLGRIGREPRSRLALLFVTEPPPMLRRAAQLLAAAILHRRLAGLVLKADRQRARDALGAEGFDVASHEAPVMLGRLVDLDALPTPSGILTDPAEPHAAAPAERLGLRAIGRYVEAVEPELLPIHRTRHDEDGEIAGSRAPVGSVGPAHADLILKLMRRRMQPWSAHIG